MTGVVDAWDPGVRGITEVLHASLVDFAYPAHCHDTWTVLIVDRGAIRYDLDSRACGAHGQTVAVLPPGVIHDGEPAPGAKGFQKRVLYLGESVLPEALVGAAVDRTAIADPALRAALVGLHDSLRVGEEPLDGEARLAGIADRLERHLRRDPDSPSPVERGVAHRFRGLLDEHVVDPIGLDAAAAVLDRSTAHLCRSFTKTFGVSPHAYVIGRRIETARALLLSGMGPATVATEVGFYDQAHFTRHFKRHTSVPPARYAASHS